MCLWLPGGDDAPVAQQPPIAPPPAELQPAAGSRLLDQINQRSLKFECKGDYCILTGEVELPLGPQTTLFADQVELFRDTNRVVAQGNVVFATPEGRLSAERLEFDVATGTGTFHDANGLMSLGAQADRRQFGNQEADVYFYGEMIEKLGPRRYRITRGGFTTCVQPTPRWEVAERQRHAESQRLRGRAEHGAAGQRRAGDVPADDLLPDPEDQRATGFLLPTYGTSTLRGQAISNAFFWAISRSTGRHVLPRLVHADRAGCGCRVPLRRGGAIHGRCAFLPFNQDETSSRMATRPRRCRRPTATRSQAT